MNQPMPGYFSEATAPDASPAPGGSGASACTRTGNLQPLPFGSPSSGGPTGGPGSIGAGVHTRTQSTYDAERAGMSPHIEFRRITCELRIV